jgi:hypothetical protein
MTEVRSQRTEIRVKNAKCKMGIANWKFGIQKRGSEQCECAKMLRGLSALEENTGNLQEVQENRPARVECLAVQHVRTYDRTVLRQSLILFSSQPSDSR